MHKKDKRTPEEIAADLENIDFAEIEDGDLKEVFGSISDVADADCNCGCDPGSNTNCGCDWES